jgi:hypothetical protein
MISTVRAATLTAGFALLTSSYQAQTLPVLDGLHTIVQQHTGRFLDAHDTSDRDFGVVTRPRQENDTQRWLFTHVGNGIHTIEQQATGRLLDAHGSNEQDFAVVTRPVQNNTTQRWTLRGIGNNQFEVRQQSNGRNLDAHDTPDKDFRVVTRPFQNNSTQRWTIRPVHTSMPAAAPGTCTIVGSVTGPLRVHFCTDPKCKEGGTATLSRVILRTTSSSEQIAVRELAGRNYVFSNVPPGPTYFVAAPGGWQFDRLGAPIRCEANRSHQIFLRVRGFASES